MARPLRCIIFVSVTILSGIGNAQTGPGGVGNSSTNVLWLSADRGVYSDAGVTPAATTNNVRQWNDRSGNGRNAIQATTAERPNYVTGVLNGQPVLRYTAANNDRMLSTGLSTANVASVFVVGRYTTLPSPNPGLLQGSTSGFGYSSDASQKSIGLWVSSSTSRPWGRGVQSDGTQRNVPEVTTLSSNTLYLFNSTYDGSTIQQYVNNGVSGSVTYNGTLRSWTDVCIGCQAGTENWNGDIAEVIVYNVAVNSAQRIIIANHLSAKYGQTLALNDIYREDDPSRGNYDHDVAGIGRVNASNIHSEAQGAGIVRISSPTNLNNNEFMFWGHNNGMLGAWGVEDLPGGVEGRLERTWRVSERNSTGTAAVDVGSVDMTFDLTGLGFVDPDHLRLLVDTDQDGLFSDETPLEGAFNTSGSLYTFAAVTQIMDGLRFTIGTSNMGITPLPIELLSFTAQANIGNTVDLAWTTATEWDNDYFNVERSTDLLSWMEVAQEEAVGHSNALVEYTSVDERPISGINYYRLRQTDLDGSSTLSSIIALEMKQETGLDLHVHPNPAQDHIFIRSSIQQQGPIELVLSDLSGRRVKQYRLWHGSGEAVSMSVEDLSPGTYILELRSGDQIGTTRFQVVR